LSQKKKGIPLLHITMDLSAGNWGVY